MKAVQSIMFNFVVIFLGVCLGIFAIEFFVHLVQRYNVPGIMAASLGGAVIGHFLIADIEKHK